MGIICNKYILVDIYLLLRHCQLQAKRQGGLSSIENDAHGIEKLLLKTQVSLTSFLQSEVKIIHIVQNNK